jgi:hypothetical protein
VPIEPVQGRLPSEVAGLHLERDGQNLRLFNTATGLYLPTIEELQRAEAQARRDAVVAFEAQAQARRDAVAAHEAEAQARRDAVAAQEEATRLRRELDELRRRLPDHPG